MVVTKECVVTALTIQCTTDTSDREGDFHRVVFKGTVWKHIAEELAPYLKDGGWQQLASQWSRHPHCNVFLTHLKDGYPCKRGWKGERVGNVPCRINSVCKGMETKVSITYLDIEELL